jgi:predicted histidine transporter YuiF (NhaC family)
MLDMIIGAVLMLVGVLFGSAISERKDDRAYKSVQAENTAKYAEAAGFNPSEKLTGK